MTDVGMSIGGLSVCRGAARGSCCGLLAVGCWPSAGWWRLTSWWCAWGKAGRERADWGSGCVVWFGKDSWVVDVVYSGLLDSQWFDSTGDDG
jgi:hypothetical protein